MNSIIQDHFLEPRNVGTIENCDTTIEVGNPVCGDQVTLHVMHTEDLITDIKYHAYGCSTSLATSSILSERLLTLSKAEIEAIEKDDVKALLGSLKPRERHCIDFGFEIVSLIQKEVFNMEVVYATH